MRTKIYLLAVACSVLWGANASAQCSVTINSLIVNGMSVSASASGVGNQYPFYSWYWDDNTTYASSYSYAQHTYAQAGGYQVCVTYTDSANQFGCITSDCDSLFITNANGTQEMEFQKASIKVSPNPVASSATISISLNQVADVEITLIDLTGRQVEVIEAGKMESGLHFVSWKPEGLGNGVYFIQIKAGNVMQTKKIIYTGGNR